MFDFFKSKFFIILCAVILFISGFSLYSATLTDGSQLANIGKTVTVFFKNCTDSVGAFFSNAFDGLFNYGNLQKENDLLKQQLNEYERKLIEFNLLEEENEKLKDLLNIINKEEEYQLTEARAVSKADNDYFSVFTINKGTNAGIEKGSAVLTEAGFAGIVSDVGPNWAIVTSVIDVDSSVGGIVLRTGDAAILKGDYSLMKKGMCKLSYILNSAILNRGDTVYTSGLGGIVPGGIKVGKITDFYTDEQGISLYAVIQPSVDFSRITNVYVVIKAD